MSSTAENAKSILDFTEFCYLPPSQLKVLNFEACGCTFNHLKTNSTKFYRLKIPKDIEYFDFQSLMQHPPGIIAKEAKSPTFQHVQRIYSEFAL